MLKITCASLTKDIEEAKKMLSPRKLKFAILNAINDTARLDVKFALQLKMRQVFDRPTPQILKGIYTKLDKEDISVRIGFKDSFWTGFGVDKILTPHVFGGSREKKNSELYLGSYYLPGKGARLNKYGNIPAGEITRILSETKTLWEGGYMGNITPESRKRKKRAKKYGNYFLIKPGHPGKLKPGVYQKIGTQVMPILVFMRGAPQYRIRFPYFQTINYAVAQNIHRRFHEAYLKELTAK